MQNALVAVLGAAEEALTTQQVAAALGPVSVTCPCLAFAEKDRPGIHRFWKANHGNAIEFDCDHTDGGRLTRGVTSDEIYATLRRMADTGVIDSRRVRDKGPSAGSIVWIAAGRADEEGSANDPG